MDEIMVSRKVCIACRNPEDDVLFIVDLDSEKWVDVRFDRFDRNSLFRPAFCFLGSKLYIFQGFEGRNMSKKEEDPLAVRIVDPIPIRAGKVEVRDEARSVLTYEFSLETFSSESGSSLKLDKSMLVQHSVLNEVKTYPIAMVTPSGKILVFSQLVVLHSARAIELYDPADGKWHMLPRLCPKWVGRHKFWVYSATFMGESLFILTTECGVFSLDLSSSKDWEFEGFYGAHCIPSHPGNGFVFIGDYLCLTPFWGYDIEEEILGEEFNVSMRSYSLATKYIHLPDDPQCPSITLVDDYDPNPQYCCFCVVQTGAGDCELVVDVYRCDVTECREELAKYRKERKEKKEYDVTPPLPGTIKVKTFKIIDSDSAYGPYKFILSSFSASSLNSYTSISI